MMKRTTNVDVTYRRLRGKKAIETFCNRVKKPEWIETFEWMYENGIEIFNDTVMGNGGYNEFWCYALTLEVEEDYIYMAIVERSEI